jgi:outer membrane protein assembly factor BamD
MIMRRKIPLLAVCFIFLFPSLSRAVWIWTPESGKFINPKMAVKSTPKEQLEYARDLIDARKYALALSELKKLIKHYPRAKQAPEAQYYIGQVMEEFRKPYEAYKAYQVVIDKYPFSERAAEIVEIEYRIANELLEGRDKRGKWVEAIVGGDDRVIEIFRSVIKNAPYGKLAAVSQYKIGLYLKERGLYQEARDEFEKTINDYPNSEWAKAAKFQTAFADTKRSGDVQHEQKVTSVALDEFKEFVKNHPDSELTPQAKEQIGHLRAKEAENAYLIGQFYEKQKNYKSAAVYYKDIIGQYADTVWGPKALTRLKIIGE